MTGGKPGSIGIMGGTFDPVHMGHLVIAEAAREDLKLDKVLFIPTGAPPHKTINVLSDRHHRLQMVREAIKGNPGFEASDIEVAREGYTYSVDTLESLKKIFGDGCKLFFIIGADTLWELLNWKQYEKVFRLCSFAVAARSGYDIAKLNRQIDFLKKHFSVDIQVAGTPLIDLSSTYIRQRVAVGKSIRYLVPDAVREYIFREGLYNVGH